MFFIDIDMDKNLNCLVGILIKQFTVYDPKLSRFFKKKL